MLDTEAAKTTSAIVGIVGAIGCANPLFAVAGIVGGTLYACAIGLDYLQTRRFFPLPIYRQDFTGLLDSIGSQDFDNQSSVTDYLSPDEDYEWAILSHHPKLIADFLGRVPAQDRALAYHNFLKQSQNGKISSWGDKPTTPQLKSAEIKPVIAHPQTQPQQAVEAPKASPVVHYDFADDMGRHPQSSIVAGVPGAGKGMLISNALRAVKLHNPQVKIFVIDPKASGKEVGYWSIADNYFKLAFSGETVEDAAEWFMSRLSQFKQFEGPKLLVIDEGATVLTTLRLAKIYEYRETPNGKEQAIKVDLLGQFKAFLTHVSSMGDSEENWMWFVSQIINCDDLGISGGQRSIFRGIGLVSPKNRKAVDNFFATGFVPLPKGGKDEVYRLMAESPCDRAYYDGKTDQWASSQPLENHSGFDRDTRQYVGVNN
jgi:hypothetical protein